MPTYPCPNCGNRAPRWLEAPSEIAVANYYRCDSCKHVFTVAKDGSGKMHHVTKPSDVSRPKQPAGTMPGMETRDA